MKAAALAGVSRAAAYKARKADPDFARAWREALGEGCDRLEEEAWRRAVEGVAEPVFYRGEQCGVIRRYSDQLLIVLLKAHRPRKFRDRHEVTGPKRGPLLRLDPNRDYHAELQAKLAAMRQRAAEFEADKKKCGSGAGGASA